MPLHRPRHGPHCNAMAWMSGVWAGVTTFDEFNIRAPLRPFQLFGRDGEQEPQHSFNSKWFLPMRSPPTGRAKLEASRV